MKISKIVAIYGPFYIGLSLAFFRTMEVLVQFAPNKFFGYESQNFSILWGVMAAFLVEGVIALSWHKLWDRNKDENTKYISIFMVIAYGLFSLACNALDVATIKGWASVSDNTIFGLFLQFIAVALPIITVFSFGIIQAIDSANPDKQDSPRRDFGGNIPWKVESVQGISRGFPQNVSLPAPKQHQKHGQQQPQRRKGGQVNRPSDLFRDKPVKVFTPTAEEVSEQEADYEEMGDTPVINNGFTGRRTE